MILGGSNMNMVEVRNVSKRFDDKLVLDNINFTIRKGEIFGLLGPNGAGKSTLISIMTGLVSSDSGDVVIGGHSIKKDPVKLKKLIGVVPQEIALFESLTAKENLEYFGALYGLTGSKLKERIKEAIELAALEEYPKKKVKDYSGGMKRRLNIAVALMNHPEVVLMDEPTVGVDPQSRNHIFEVVKKMNREYNTTIIYTSHYMEEVEYLCSNVFIQDLGKEVAFGQKDELKRMIHSGTTMIIKGSGDFDSFILNIKGNIDVKSVEKIEEGIKITSNKKINFNKIFEEAQKSQIEIKNIFVEEPTLEQVFLTLTGKQLRDKEA